MDDDQDDQAPDELPRSTPIFVREPGPRSTRAEVEALEAQVECESAEAASHWDRRSWHRSEVQ